MHVFDIKTRILLANLTSSSPKFALHLGASSVGHGGPYGPDESPRTHSWKSNALGGDGDTKTIRRGSGSGSGNGIYGSIAVIPPVGTLLQVTAVNAHGNSDSVFIEATSVVGLPAEMQTGGVSNFEFTPTLGILIGIVVTGILMMAVLIAGLRLRCNRPPVPKDLKESRKEYLELGTRDPDVIAKEKGTLIANHIILN